MARNIELLTKVRDLIKAEPSKLDMGSWATVPVSDVDERPSGTAKIKVTCGTSACIAGWAAQLSGDKLLITGWDFDSIEDVYYVESFIAKNGREINAHDRGRSLLGLTDAEASWLFMLDDDEAVPALNHLIAGGDINSWYYDDDNND